MEIPLRAWWKGFDFSNHPRNSELHIVADFLNWAEKIMLASSFSGKTTKACRLDLMAKSVLPDEIEEFLKERSAVRVFEAFDFNGMIDLALFVWETGCLSISFISETRKVDKKTVLETGEVKVKDAGVVVVDESPGECTVRFIVNDKNDLRELLEIVRSNLIEPKAQEPQDLGYAWVIANIPDHGIRMVPVGLSAQPLDRGNYPDDALVQFDRAVADLGEKNPSGRLVILNGPTGTGKTHMVRGLMDAAKRSKFVIVPSHLIQNLADPGLVLTLIREMNNKEPTVLVIEDADHCLSPRDKDNLNAISALLNLSDGIIGSLLDLRVVATTNVKDEEIDPALFRKGRLSAHVNIKNLSEEQARKVWRNIGGPPELFPEGDLKTIFSDIDVTKNNSQSVIGKEISLANVYGAYNQMPKIGSIQPKEETKPDKNVN